MPMPHAPEQSFPGRDGAEFGGPGLDEAMSLRALTFLLDGGLIATHQVPGAYEELTGKTLDGGVEDDTEHLLAEAQAEADAPTAATEPADYHYGSSLH